MTAPRLRAKQTTLRHSPRRLAPTDAGRPARPAGLTRTDNDWAYKRSLRGFIGDRNTYTSIYPGGNGVHPKLRGFLTGGGGATSETKLSGAAP